MSTRTIAGKIRYLILHDPPVGESETRLTIALWQNFYYEYMTVGATEEGGLLVIFKPGADFRKIPTWQQVAATYARMRRKAEIAVRVPYAAPLPYKDDVT